MDSNKINFEKKSENSFFEDMVDQTIFSFFLKRKKDRLIITDTSFVIQIRNKDRHQLNFKYVESIVYNGNNSTITITTDLKRHVYDLRKMNINYEEGKFIKQGIQNFKLKG